MALAAFSLFFVPILVTLLCKPGQRFCGTCHWMCITFQLNFLQFRILLCVCESQSPQDSPWNPEIPPTSCPTSLTKWFVLSFLLLKRIHTLVVFLPWCFGHAALFLWKPMAEAFRGLGNSREYVNTLMLELWTWYFNNFVYLAPACSITAPYTHTHTHTKYLLQE